MGDHGLEYMTGGTAVILGRVGRNFAAGMSGGTAYVLDEKRDLYTKLNKSLVDYSAVETEEDISLLTKLLEEHVSYTGSAKAKEILGNIEGYLPLFKKVIPHDYKRMITSIKKFTEMGQSAEEAKISAFYENIGG